MSKNKRPRLVMVDWHDAFSRSEWIHEDDVRQEFSNCGWACVNVGYLIEDEKSHITLASRAAFDNESYGLLQRIPRGMVESIRTLK